MFYIVEIKQMWAGPKTSAIDLRQPLYEHFMKTCSQNGIFQEEQFKLNATLK